MYLSYLPYYVKGVISAPLYWPVALFKVAFAIGIYFDHCK